MSKFKELFDMTMNESKFKVGDKGKINSGMGGSFDIVIKSIDGDTYTVITKNKMYPEWNNNILKVKSKDIFK